MTEGTIEGAATEAEAIAPEGDDSLGGEIEETVIGFEGEEAPEPEPETPLVKQMRKKLEEANKAKREAERRAAELESKVAPPAESEARPDIYDFPDDAAYEAALEKWITGKAAREAKAAEAKAAEQAQQDAFKARLESYNTAKAAVGVSDFAEREATVSDALTLPQQAALLKAASNPAGMVAALGKSAEKLKELAAIKDPIEFTAALVRLEGKLKMETRKAPAPESRLPGSSAGGATAKTVQARIDVLEKQFDAGTLKDRSEIIRLTKQLRAG